MNVQELMTSHVKTCTPENNLAEVAGILFENDCGALPVVDELGKLLGMITDRDVCIAVGTNHRPAGELRVASLSTSACYFCRPEQGVVSALETMIKGRVRRLPVVGNDGTVRGILSLNDIILYAVEVTSRSKDGLNSAHVLLTLKAICQHRDALQRREEMRQAA